MKLQRTARVVTVLLAVAGCGASKRGDVAGRTGDAGAHGGSDRGGASGGLSATGGSGAGSANAGGASVGGSAGLAGDAGSAGAAGMVGIPDIVESDCSDPPTGTGTPACGEVCGNGKVDSCVVFRPPDATFPPGMCGSTPMPPACVEVWESCDGAQSAGSSCADLGFVDGTLGCTAWCAWNAQNCNACSGDAHVGACNEHLLGLTDPGNALALSSDGSQVAVALTGSRKIHIGIVAGDLEPVGPERCYLPGVVAEQLAIPSVPGGYLLVARGRYSSLPLAIQTLPLDAEGVPRGGGTLLTPEGGMMRVVERPDGGPLVLVTRTGTDAFLLDADGRTLVTARVSDDRNASVVAATYAGGAFLVWGLTGTASARQFETTRIALDGSVTKKVVPEAQRVHYGPVIFDGEEGRSVWMDASNVMLARIDVNGDLLGSPQTVASGNFYSVIDLAETDVGTLVLLRDREGTAAGPGLSALRIDPSGAASAPHPVARNANQAGQRLVGFGDDAIVAFWQYAAQVYPGRVGLARLVP